MIECVALVTAWLGIESLIDELLQMNDFLNENKYNAILIIFLISHSAFFLIAFLQCAFYNFFNQFTLIVRLIGESCLNVFMYFFGVLMWKLYWDVGYLIVDLTSNRILCYLCANVFSFCVAMMIGVGGVLTGPSVLTFDGDKKHNNVYFDIEYLSVILKVCFQVIFKKDLTNDKKVINFYFIF